MMEWLREHFAPGPLFGWLCVVFVLLIPLVWIQFRRQGRQATVRYSSVRSLSFLRPTWASRMRFVLPLLRSLAIAALVVALARPQSGGTYRAASEGIAIQMVLDVSGSMAEEDFVIDGRRVRRLDAVRKVFKDFVLGQGDLRGREGDLIGMTAFAMFADTACPLTLDHASVVDLLDQTEIPGFADGRQVREDEEAGYTALGDAIVMATDTLRRAGEQAAAGVPGAEAARSRVMILLTDGKDNPAPFRGVDAPDPIEGAKLAARLGIKIYTIGAVRSAPQRRSMLGFSLRSRAEVDEAALRRIADLTGAKYFRATDTESLRTIYNEIDQLERRKTGERLYEDNIYAARIALLTAMGLLGLELLLASTRFRRVP